MYDDDHIVHPDIYMECSRYGSCNDIQVGTGIVEVQFLIFGSA